MKKFKNLAILFMTDDTMERVKDTIGRNTYKGLKHGNEGAAAIYQCMFQLSSVAILIMTERTTSYTV